MCQETDTKVNETKSLSATMLTALDTPGKVMTDDYKQVTKHQLLHGSLSEYLKWFVFIFLRRRQVFTVIYFWRKSVCPPTMKSFYCTALFQLCLCRKEQVQHYQDVGCNQWPLPRYLELSFVDGTFSKWAGSQTLLAGPHFKHHLIAWCDSLLSDDPVLIYKHSHYQAQTDQNLAKPWWNRNKHNV